MGGGHGSARVTSSGEGGIPGVLSPSQELWGMKVQADSLERAVRDCSVTDRQHSFGRKTWPL